MSTAKPRIAILQRQIISIESAVDEEMKKYGESLKKQTDDDSCLLFFSTIAKFARTLVSTYEEIEKQRIVEEKELERLQNKTSSKPVEQTEASRDSTPKRTDNLFGMYHIAQQASTESVLAEFKMKMAKKMQK